MFSLLGCSRTFLPQECEIRDICNRAKGIFVMEDNVLSVSSPITLCGDLHGQFSDLLEIIDVSGDPQECPYLFMGDYVDRGAFSVETFILLLAFKIRYPDRIWMIRGNHESRQITQVYGFYDECLRKYGSSNVWRYCCDVFDNLPVAAIVDSQIFVVHGGISPSLTSIDSIRTIDRFQEPPTDGLISDLLWSDPDEFVPGFAVSSRGAGTVFGKSAVDEFLHANDMQIIARAHQLVMEGYKWMFDEKLVTIWSASNYCYRCGNLAAVMTIDGQSHTPIVFDSTPIERGKLVESTATIEYFV
jgi:serine/threonine-protein phosphatase 4 catalytic subunit